MENIAPAGPVSQAGNFGTSGTLNGVHTTPGTGYRALTWAVVGIGAITQGAGNLVSFGTETSALVQVSTADAHVSLVVPTAPTAAGQLYMMLATKYLVDLYNGAISILVNNTGTIAALGLTTPSAYTASNGDTIEAILTSGLLEVWATTSGTRTKINSFYVGRTYEDSAAIGFGMACFASSTSATVSNFKLRY